MTKCVFCGSDEHDFRGVHLIKNDGSIDFYCSSKCRKNVLKLGRDKRKVRWTEAFRLQRHKDAAKAVVKEAKRVEDAKNAVAVKK